ncbi:MULTISPECIES: GFA family protein [unclassified Photorhabdus]|uniref:GFA family protein n=1 Tax=unclassified Photorhabdus TaxID=2620880 RepID=UPI001863DF21|nr:MULTISPECIES: GFA family protein [unclassified Photorhabdus]
MLIPGSCHCKNIEFMFNWEPEPLEIPARTCTCSFCTKHSAVWTSYPTGQLRLSIRDQKLLHKYSFETGTAQFYICSKCGIVPIVISQINGRDYAVVNVNTFEDVDPALLKYVAAKFTDESEQARLTRRQQHWIANVEYI